MVSDLPENGLDTRASIAETVNQIRGQNIFVKLLNLQFWASRIFPKIKVSTETKWHWNAGLSSLD